MNFRIAGDQVGHLETTVNDFLAVFSSFELEGITNLLTTGPAGNNEFCFPSTSTFPSGSPRETLRSRVNKTLFPLGPVTKVLLFTGGNLVNNQYILEVIQLETWTEALVRIL